MVWNWKEGCETQFLKAHIHILKKICEGQRRLFKDYRKQFVFLRFGWILGWPEYLDFVPFYLKRKHDISVHICTSTYVTKLDSECFWNWWVELSQIFSIKINMPVKIDCGKEKPQMTQLPFPAFTSELVTKIQCLVLSPYLLCLCQ
jgi:hypothetical protein